MADTRIIRVLKGTGGAPRWRPGQLVEMPTEEAEKWADGHRAVFVDTVPVDEVHTVPAPPAVTDAADDTPDAGDDNPPGPEQGDGEQPPTDDPPVDPPEVPAGNASRDEWAAYVVDVLKVDPAEIEGLGRNELRDRYGAPMDTEA